eukprot:gene17760-27340_t
MSADSAVALAAIVERFTRDVVSAASNTLEGKKKTLGPRHLAIALSNDSALRDLAGNAHVCGGGFVSDVTVENLQSPRRPKKQKKRKAKKRPAKKASAKKMIAKKTKGPPRGAGQLTRKAAIAAAAAAAGTGPPTDPKPASLE